MYGNLYPFMQPQGHQRNGFLPFSYGAKHLEIMGKYELRIFPSIPAPLRGVKILSGGHFKVLFQSIFYEDSREEKRNLKFFDLTSDKRKGIVKEGLITKQFIRIGR